MTDNEIKCEKCFHQSVCEKKTCAECQSSYCDECELYDFYNGKPYVEDCEKFIDADFINRQKEEITKNEKIIEAAENLIDVQKSEIESLISGQETLQKFISEKDAEIEKLQKENTELDGANILLTVTLQKAKSEAVKEFAERFLKKIHAYEYLVTDRINSKDYGMFTVGIEQAVKETEKEMVGE